MDAYTDCGSLELVRVYRRVACVVVWCMYRMDKIRIIERCGSMMISILDICYYMIANLT